MNNPQSKNMEGRCEWCGHIGPLVEGSTGPKKKRRVVYVCANQLDCAKRRDKR